MADPEKRSILRIGGPAGSSAVTLPVAFVRKNNLKAGDKVIVLLNRKSLLITTDRKVAERLREQLADADDEAHEKHADAIQEAFVEEGTKE